MGPLTAFKRRSATDRYRLRKYASPAERPIHLETCGYLRALGTRGGNLAFDAYAIALPSLPLER
jgi:hypothetical protein